MPAPSQSPTPNRDARGSYALDDFDVDDPMSEPAAPVGRAAIPRVRPVADAKFNLLSEDFDLPPRQEWEIATNFYNKY